jgi:hypothetical protein
MFGQHGLGHIRGSIHRAAIALLILHRLLCLLDLELTKLLLLLFLRHLRLHGLGLRVALNAAHQPAREVRAEVGFALLALKQARSGHEKTDLLRVVQVQRQIEDAH